MAKTQFLFRESKEKYQFIYILRSELERTFLYHMFALIYFCKSFENRVCEVFLFQIFYGKESTVFSLYVFRLLVFYFSRIYCWGEELREKMFHPPRK